MSTPLFQLPPNTPPAASERLYRRVGLIYALQLGGFFTVGITFLLAALLNARLQTPTRGTWLAGHTHWQWQTFLGASVGSLLGLFPLWLGFGWFIWFFTSLWIFYRALKGGYAWFERRPIP